MRIDEMIPHFENEFGSAGLAVIIVVVDDEGQVHALSANRFARNDSDDSVLKRQIAFAVSKWLDDFKEEECIGGA